MSSPPQNFAPRPITPSPRTRTRSRSIPRAERSSTSAREAAPPVPSVGTSALTASPHYVTSTRSRHSLYGTEDRVVLDLGGRVWKVGFGGEPGPRVVCPAPLEGGSTLGAGAGGVGEVEWEVRGEKLKRALRHVWFT